MLLVFDEAHLLDGDALTDLRLLNSSAPDVGPPLKMLLVGQDSGHSSRQIAVGTPRPSLQRHKHEAEIGRTAQDSNSIRLATHGLHVTVSVFAVRDVIRNQPGIAPHTKHPLQC